MEYIFITGTDTGCGKTYITQQLVTFYRKKGKRVLALKPVVSGEIPGKKGCFEDVMALEEANLPEKKTIHCCAFEEPIAPHIAAAIIQQKIDLDTLVHFCRSEEFEQSFDLILIEGAGGLQVPLNEENTWIDFIQSMQAQVIVVVGMRLGALNHALLTMTALAVYNIECIGWVANQIDSDMPYLNENIMTLKSMIRAPMIAFNPWNGFLDESY